MNRPTLELRNAEFRLMVARRRAARGVPASPAWDTAIEAVHHFEEQISQLDEHANEHRWLGFGAATLPN